MTGMVRDMEPDVARMRAGGRRGLCHRHRSCRLAGARRSKLPFREAHHITGRIVAKAAEAGVPLDKLPLAAMQAIEPRITKAVFGVLSVDRLGEKPQRLWRHGAEKRPGAQAKRWLKRLKKG